MGSKLDLALKIKAEDYASQVVKKTAEQIKKSSKDVENQSKKTATTEQQTIKKTATLTEQSYRKISQMARMAATERQALGIRSERSIQQEINRTRQAYERLKNSGVATSRELSRAYAQQQAKIQALNAEMGKTSAMQKTANIAKGAVGLATGITAGAMVMREPVRKQMSFDRELAMTANTAFSDRDVKGRIEGKKELFNAVEKAVQTGGGTKEEALGALNKLLASGEVKADTAMNLLPTLQKGAVATGASTEDLAQIANALIQQFKVKEKDIGKALDMAIAAGQAGNFELREMARWLPKQMGLADQIGLTGLEGFQKLLVANQQARVTAGTSDEAGNNLMNLLGKIISKETAERFKQLEVTKNGKKYGIDFLKSMEDYKSKGQNSLQAFISIMDDVIGNNKEYKALQEKLKTAKTEDQKALLDQMTKLAEGTAIGQVISDKEALMSLLGIRNNVQLDKKVNDDINNSQGEGDRSHQVIKSTNDYKVEDLKNTAEFAQMKSLEGFNNKLGDVSSTLAEYAKAYPELSTAIAGAATGIAALGVAASVAAISLRGLGGFKKSGDLLDVGDKIKKGSPAAGIKMGKILKNVAKGGIVFESITHSEELNKGENDFLNLKQKIQSGTATPEQKALSDAGVANNLNSVEKARKAREQYEKEKGFPAMNDDEKARYDNAVRSLLKKNTSRQFDELLNTTNSWFGSKTQKENAKNKLYDLDENYLSDGQKKQIEMLKLEDKRKQLNNASSVTNGFGFLTASTQEKEQARAILDNQSFSKEIQNLGQHIQDGLIQAVQNQEHKIENKIVVELDGRVVAEKTSEYQYREMNRG